MRNRVLIGVVACGLFGRPAVGRAQAPVDPIEVAQAPSTPPAPAPALPRPGLPATAPSARPRPGAAFAAPSPPTAALSSPSASSGYASMYDPSAAPGGLLGTSSFSGGSNPQMIGDQAPFAVRQQITLPSPPAIPRPTPPGTPPPPPSPRQASALVPSVRGFKVAENQSPAPRDRVYASFNYFNDLNGAINRRFEAPIKNLQAYRYILGLEKTFDAGRGSIGALLPINTLSARPSISGNFAKAGGNSTLTGNMGVFAKYVLKANPETGSLISAGIQLSLPTGPTQFAGARYITGLNDTLIEPFVGYLFVRDRFYLQGFSSISTPSSARDVTMVYNDLGIGYFLMRSGDPNRLISAIAPTFEVHANTPLTHRNPFDATDIAGTPAVVDLTYGLNLTLKGRSILTFGAVTPVTGPRPFNVEFLALVNVFFGPSARRNVPPPILGG